MKYGIRKPSLTKSISARTKGRATRAIKRAIIPGYDKRGMGLLHPKRALYNRVYRRTTFSIFDLGKTSRRKTANNGGCLVLLIVIISIGTAIMTI